MPNFLPVIRNWRAKRAGGRITIYGKDGDTQNDIRVANVDVIECSDIGPVATDKNGVRYSLQPENAAGSPA